MKTLRKRLLSLLLTVSMLLALIPITATTVSASTPTSMTKTYEPRKVLNKLVGRTYSLDCSAAGTFFNETYEKWQVESDDWAPHYDSFNGSFDQWFCFDFDTTNIKYMTNYAAFESNLAIYIDVYLDGATADSDAKETFAETNVVERTWTRNGKTYVDNGMSDENPGRDWALNIPLEAKGTIKIKFSKSKTTFDPYDMYRVTKIRMRNSSVAGYFNGAMSGTATFSKFGWADDVMAPPEGFKLSQPNGFTEVLGSNKQPSADFDGEFTQNAESGSRLAIYFDTMNVPTAKSEAEAGQSWDVNCVAFDVLYVWDGKGWSDIKNYLVGGAYSADSMTTVFIRDEDGVQVTRTITGKGYNYNWNGKTWTGGASTSFFTLPSASRGYVIFEFANPDQIRTLSGFRLGNQCWATTVSKNKAIYMGNAGVIPPNTALAATEGLDIVRSDEDDYTVTVDADKEIKAGTLLVYNTSNGKLATMQRTGYPGTNDQDLNSNSFNNTTKFTFNLEKAKVPAQDVVVKADYYDTSSTTPNMGLLGYQTKDEKIRIQYRANVKWDSDAGKYYMNCGGAKKYVESFGMLMATEKMKNTYGLTLEAVETSGGKVKMADFVVRRNRNDACAAWHDVCITYTGLNTEAKQETQIYTTWFVKFEGETTVHYGEEVHRSYSEIEAIKNANA